MFSNAIVRTPGKSVIHGLTSANLGVPDYESALRQHQAYIEALQECDLAVTILPPEEDFPDSTFVEDVALLTPHCAIITNPGVPMRKGETEKIRETITKFYSEFDEIQEPGTMEGGDVMTVGDHHYIGLSERTNLAGANQLIQILENHGMTGSVLEIEKLLHLKTGVSYLENNNLILCTEFEQKPEFDDFNKIVVPKKETYASNCIWINGTVIVPDGHPVTTQKIVELGYSVIELDISEFQKLDGGLSCLSLRF